MRRLSSAWVSVFALAASIAVARGDEATNLLFFSGDLMSKRSFAGLGWLHAASGLDLSGPVFAVEIGRQQINLAYGQAAAGWRFSQPGFSLTLLGGAELAPGAAPAARPLASADLWWEPAKNWMATAQVQTTPAYVSWRLAAGLKPAENWPWIGPEAAASTGELRAGLHATGLRLGGGFEARVATGISWCGQRAGPYGELAVWRRF
ncbi:cellulose biosynthesis protein BcsS [Methylocapsa sp. S129]|uniref:cellulose biosynthesis protein BcsS n=1 Tax=Methylocapsa sp. S129 TaxID=1641869 RepID=UPI00131EC263|nr:cellulose biosynthesis protein BcsS [Methylocapsa sp. S129]